MTIIRGAVGVPLLDSMALLGGLDEREREVFLRVVALVSLLSAELDWIEPLSEVEGFRAMVRALS
ncbi:MAG: hypothetical protein RIB58_07240 [Phycisphaerales bacterium]